MCCVCSLSSGVIANVHYLHFAIILACVTFVVTVGVSIMTEPRKENQVRFFVSFCVSMLYCTYCTGMQQLY